jgi:hypothetical protein
MAQAEVARAPGIPWSLRFFEASPLAPHWLGLTVVAGILAVYWGLYLVLREIDPFLAGAEHERLAIDVRATVINTLLLGYWLAAQAWLEGAARRATVQIRALNPGFEPSLATAPFTRKSGRRAGLLGMGLLAVAVFIAPAAYRYWNDPGYWIFPHVWQLLSVFPLGWIVGRYAWAVVARTREISRFATRLPSVDLLDLSSFAPFVRYGHRGALVWVGLITIVSLHLLDPGAMRGVLSMTPLLIAVPAVVLVMPVRGAHTRIRQAKDVRLKGLRDEIRAAEAGLAGGGPEADRAAAYLPALLALEARIDAVPAWPFDASSLLRFGFYLLLGLGSWLGAAAVERLLDLALV